MALPAQAVVTHSESVLRERVGLNRMDSAWSGSGESLLDYVDRLRVRASRRLDPVRKARMGQFLTPAPVARLMASMVTTRRKTISLLDAGAGIGSLVAAVVERMCSSKLRPAKLEVSAYELDPVLADHLQDTFGACQALCEASGVAFEAEILQEDFIEAGVAMLGGSLFSVRQRRGFDLALLNPPYRKIRSDSAERRLLRSIGVETVNLYAGFMAIVIKLLNPNGQLVAVTPRSFCNGPYFRPFRRLLLRTMTLRRLHVFERRDRAFQDDDVLQEHVILHAVKTRSEPAQVMVSSSADGTSSSATSRRAPYSELVEADDPELFIHIMTDPADVEIVRRVRCLGHSLEDIGVSVSTGRVVDFRAKEFLRHAPNEHTAPLIYPTHFYEGRIRWPKPRTRKPNAIVACRDTADLLVPSGTYVLVKRFSAKEERRRIVAAVHDPKHVPCSTVGFENHLNYYHQDGRGMPPALARGLALFLNSTLVDRFFRLFSGHTQVNATDLRRLRYPSVGKLRHLGGKADCGHLGQKDIDSLVEQRLLR